MKKYLSLLFALLLTLGLASCGGGTTAESEPPVTATTIEDTSLLSLRQKLAETDDIGGILYLGYMEDGKAIDQFLTDSGYLASYPFLASIDEAHIARNEGGEVYCLVPKDQKAALTVQKFIIDESNNYEGAPGEVLYTGDGSPVLLIGNVSDIMPNLYVTLVGTDGKVLTYTPSLSLCDGHVDLPVSPTLHDFTIYELVIPRTAAPASFLGSWKNNAQQSLSFTEATMTYGNGSVTYTGTYHSITEGGVYPEGSVFLEVSDGNTEYSGVFSLVLGDGTLTVTHLEGDPLPGQSANGSLTFQTT